MVACENPDCLIEWFHFECVGLKTEVNDIDLSVQDEHAITFNNN